MEDRRKRVRFDSPLITGRKIATPLSTPSTPPINYSPSASPLPPFRRILENGPRIISTSSTSIPITIFLERGPLLRVPGSSGIAVRSFSLDSIVLSTRGANIVSTPAIISLPPRRTINLLKAKDPSSPAKTAGLSSNATSAGHDNNNQGCRRHGKSLAARLFNAVFSPSSTSYVSPSHSHSLSSLNLGSEVQQDGARGSVMANHYASPPPVPTEPENSALAIGSRCGAGGDRKSGEPSSHAPSKTSLPLRHTISITALPSANSSCTAGKEVKQFEGGEEAPTCCRQQGPLLAGGPRGDHAPPLPPQPHSGKSIAAVGECRRQEDTDAALIGTAVVARVEVSCPLGVIKTGRNRARGD